MSERRDYTRSGFHITLLIIVFLVCVSFVPGFRVMGVTVKRANILSDVFTFQDERIVPLSDVSVLDTSFLAAYEPLEETTPEVENVQQPSVVVEEKETAAEFEGLSVPHIEDSDIVQITDYSPDGQMMAGFYHALAYESGDRTVRIAVLGDSFIEADIITADMREQLQMEYGGSGVGFVPFSTPLSKYRGTVTHNHSGWTNYNLIKLKTVPEEYKEWFMVSGMLSIPSEGATTEYKGVQFRKRIEKTNTASLFFVNRGETVLDVALNGGESQCYEPAPSDSMQCISMGMDGIESLRVKLSNTDGFIGYGAVLEDTVGVSVHNFSVRSNSGLALMATDRDINREFDGFLKYDMVILQYGLNAMAADVTDYGYYGRQLVRLINYIKECFPGSAVVVMSVGDRSTMQNGVAVTMPAVKAMLHTQEEAAKACGVGFWNTYEAMGGDNSMPEFVKRNWAAKDYTHIGYSGGKYIASQFVTFIKAAVESVVMQDEERAVMEAAAEAEERRHKAAQLMGEGILSVDSLAADIEAASDGRFKMEMYNDGERKADSAAVEVTEEAVLPAVYIEHVADDGEEVVADSVASDVVEPDAAETDRSDNA